MADPLIGKLQKVPARSEEARNRLTTKLLLRIIAILLAPLTLLLLRRYDLI